MVGHSDEGYVDLKNHQDGVRVVNHQCPIDAISFGIPMSPVMAAIFGVWGGGVV